MRESQKNQQQNFCFLSFFWISGTLRRKGLGGRIPFGKLEEIEFKALFQNVLQT